MMDNNLFRHFKAILVLSAHFTEIEFVLHAISSFAQLDGRDSIFKDIDLRVPSPFITFLWHTFVLLYQESWSENKFFKGFNNLIKFKD